MKRKPTGHLKPASAEPLPEDPVAGDQVIDQKLLDEAKRSLMPEIDNARRKVHGLRRGLRAQFYRRLVLGLPPVEDQRVARFRSANRSGVASARS